MKVLCPLSFIAFYARYDCLLFNCDHNVFFFNQCNQQLKNEVSQVSLCQKSSLNLKTLRNVYLINAFTFAFGSLIL